MLILTAKLNKQKLIAAAVLFCVAIGSLFFMKDDAAETFANTGKMSDAAARLEFIESLGWQVEEGDFMEVNIPDEFDDVYEKYNELQRSQGFDLTKYKGKRAMHYSYVIKNYPTGEEGVTLCLVVYKDKIIAGDVSSPKLDDFMHGLDMPKKEG
ncbi:MAG: DUF4830 domain-containing protein [Clostridia bacterium]|nr:DUF4830 domain-containing protein [Clostridia bacterium]